MSAPTAPRELSESELCNLDFVPRTALDRCSLSTPGSLRPKPWTLAECLAEVAQNTPHGFTKITGGPDPITCPWDCGNTPAPWLAIDAVTAAMEPAPVTVHIAAGTTPKAARRILKLMRQWLKTRDSLEGFTPAPRDSHSDDLPF
jgi:hypothetical protein